MKPAKHELRIFDGEPIASPTDQLPPGRKKKFLKGGDGARRFHKERSATAEVWLCDVSETAPVKIKLLHQAVGPTCQAQCEDFVKLWREDAPVKPPPQCAADGKKPKPPADHDELDFGDARIV